jgi:hypothetical protein
MSAKRASRSAAKAESVSPSQTGKHQEFYVSGAVGPQGGPSAGEWYALRKSVFAELRKYEIPENLVDAVHDFRPHAAVTWLNDKGEPATSDDVLVVPMVMESDRESPQPTQFVSELRDNLDDLWQWKLPTTAGDALAVYLRAQLNRTRTETAPVRANELLAPSIIARVAIDILGHFALVDQPPGYELVELFSALLGVDKKRLEGDRQFEAWKKAAWIVAQAPDVGIRELARLVNVNASSVSRWRKDPSFCEEVELTKRSIEVMKRQGIWPPAKMRQPRASQSE